MRHRIKKGAVKIVSCRGSKLVRYTFGVLMMLALAFGSISCTNAQAQTEDYICSDYEYAVVDPMYHACMSSVELRNDFKTAFPKEYAIMMADGNKHDCLECRLKAIRSCYDDAVWADMFDDENSYCISHQFLVLVTVNKELGEMWNNIGKSLGTDYVLYIRPGKSVANAIGAQTRTIWLLYLCLYQPIWMGV